MQIRWKMAQVCNNIQSEDCPYQDGKCQREGGGGMSMVGEEPWEVRAGGIGWIRHGDQGTAREYSRGIVIALHGDRW